jgi:hypothetical protein
MFCINTNSVNSHSQLLVLVLAHRQARKHNTQQQHQQQWRMATGGWRLAYHGHGLGSGLYHYQLSLR